MNNENSSGAETRLVQIVEDAYRTTRLRFEAARDSQTLLPYVVPRSTAPRVGFAIFYTPVRHRPPLLIVGQNPANFAGPRRSLEDDPNRSMLDGQPPTVNSYLEHDHEFAVVLRRRFRGHDLLLRSAVGMNVWHFQQPAETDKLPSTAFLRECETTTLDLVLAIEPKAILCFSARARDLFARHVSSPCWYVPHLTSSRHRAKAELKLPATLGEIEASLLPK